MNDLRGVEHESATKAGGGSHGVSKASLPARAEHLRPDPYYDDGQITLYCGDNRTLIRRFPAVDAVVTDPPYGDTSLEWDRTLGDLWLELLFVVSLTVRQLWCFGGSFRFWLRPMLTKFQQADWRYAQEIVWEKHNGSGFQADRFKRVHELAVHCGIAAEWESLPP